MAARAMGFPAPVAAANAAVVVTAHTLDDQIETVFMRILRERDREGWRPYAESEIIRPFLDIGREADSMLARVACRMYGIHPTATQHLRNR